GAALEAAARAGAALEAAGAGAAAPPEEGGDASPARAGPPRFAPKRSASRLPRAAPPAPADLEAYEAWRAGRPDWATPRADDLYERPPAAWRGGPIIVSPEIRPRPRGGARPRPRVWRQGFRKGYRSGVKDGARARDGGRVGAAPGFDRRWTALGGKRRWDFERRAGRREGGRRSGRVGDRFGDRPDAPRGGGRLDGGFRLRGESHVQRRWHVQGGLRRGHGGLAPRR
ncbi:MAG: hypothetical protein AAFU61_10500, partial [Pseudomonadota bacterium]